MAAAGAGADQVLPAGLRRCRSTARCWRRCCARAQTVYRRDMASARYPEEDEFLALGLRCRLAAPLLPGARAIGMLALVRRGARRVQRPRRSSSPALLGRLVATAVQNIRAYEAERETVDELRRLSALRADFVSLVSHELRSPMAAVIGSATDAAAALARALARAARGVPRADRRRDRPARGADRRRARHVAHRGRHLQLPFARRRRRRARRATSVATAAARPGRGAVVARRAPAAPAGPRRRASGCGRC